MPLNLNNIFNGNHKACKAFISSCMQEGAATVAKLGGRENLIMFSKLVTTSSFTPARIMSPFASSRIEMDFDGVSG